MKKLFFTLLLAVTLSATAYSQNIGIIAGGGTSFMFWKSTDAEENKTINDGFLPIYSYNAGFSFENGLIDKKLYLQFGLFAMRKGYDYKEEVTGYEMFMHMHYFHLPLELKYKFFFDADEEFSFNIGAGGYFGGGFGGTKGFTGSDLIPGFDPKVEFGKTSGEDMRDIDYGLQFRGEMGLSNFRLGYCYGLGLANANLQNPDAVKETHRYHQLYIGYYFSNN